jgi:hypothetical protein
MPKRERLEHLFVMKEDEIVRGNRVFLSCFIGSAFIGMRLSKVKRIAANGLSKRAVHRECVYDLSKG